MNEYLGQILYIKPNCIVSVPEFDSPKRHFSAARIANHANLKHNKHNSTLSPKAINRIKGAINWLVASAKEKPVYNSHSNKTFNFKVNLITLTLPDTSEKITEYQFKKKLFHPFLVYLKKYHKLNNYVWKVEFQNNGKLHVHLTTDTFISHWVIREVWNRILNNNGFLNDFKKKFKHDNPNSTDVHAVWKVKDLAAYLAKYLSKNEQNTATVNGRIWGCNYELSAKNGCKLCVDRNEAHEVLRCLMHGDIEYKVIENQDKLTGKVFKTAEIFFIKQRHWSGYLHPKIKKAYDNHRFNIRHGIIEAPIDLFQVPKEKYTEPLVPVIASYDKKFIVQELALEFN